MYHRAFRSLVVSCVCRSRKFCSFSLSLLDDGFFRVRYYPCAWRHRKAFELHRTSEAFDEVSSTIDDDTKLRDRESHPAICCLEWETPSSFDFLSTYRYVLEHQVPCPPSTVLFYLVLYDTIEREYIILLSSGFWLFSALPSYHSVTTVTVFSKG